MEMERRISSLRLGASSEAENASLGEMAPGGAFFFGKGIPLWTERERDGTYDPGKFFSHIQTEASIQWSRRGAEC